jgi:DUF438 domain-containing protein
MEKLLEEIRKTLRNVEPDKYQVRKKNDIELETGFMNPEEIEEVFRSLPVELTYADNNNRIRFYSKSRFTGGFPRAKTIVGRKLYYCHPPRLEGYVRLNVKLLKDGKAAYREFWTRMGNRIIRVLIAGVKNKEGKYLGTLEIVEDLTDVIEKPEEIKKKIMIL